MLLAPHTVLVVVDVQGKLADIVHESDLVIRNVRTLIEGARLLEIPVVVTEQYPKGLGPTIPAVAELLEGAFLTEKHTFSCCGNHDFNTHMMTLHRQDVLLCGIETHVCVYQTARDLIDDGYTVHVVTDAVSSRTPANRQLGIDRMLAMGAIATGTEMALFELLRESGTDVFKAISKLVR